MVTILDCIERTPKIMAEILQNQNMIFDGLCSYIKDKELDELIFIGSGTSNTSSITAYHFVERMSGLDTRTMIPNEFLKKKILNPHALYVFVSQSGTSTLTNQSLKRIKDLGYANVCISAEEDSALAKLSDCVVPLSCGYEEYGMRTIGYSCTVLIEMLMGIQIGEVRGVIDEEQKKLFNEDAFKMLDGFVDMLDNFRAWYKENRRALLEVESFVLYGAGCLWGVALEGALKILEMTRNTLAVGYEMDDGCHGPTMGFTNRFGVIVLDGEDGDSVTADRLSEFVKCELGFCSLVGSTKKDQRDVYHKNYSRYFKAIEYAAFVQCLAYHLAIDKGTILKPTKEMKPLPETKYFKMHS